LLIIRKRDIHFYNFVKFQDTRTLSSEKRILAKRLKSLKILYQDINKMMAKILKVPEYSYGYLPAGRL